MYQAITITTEIQPVLKPAIRDLAKATGRIAKKIWDGAVWTVEAIFAPCPVQQQIDEVRHRAMRNYFIY